MREGSHGPSPHAWGNSLIILVASLCPRTIPTRVGKFACMSQSPWYRPDHPHTRGEIVLASEKMVPRDGPSPHAWGNSTANTSATSYTRTIPTRVGKLNGSSPFLPASSDHPHTRGEINLRPASCIAGVGPSPHAWGNLIPEWTAFAKLRTIPTRVGKLLLLSMPAGHTSDHPHTRGEIPSMTPGACSHFGPSPHAWGNSNDVLGVSIYSRTIPTRVGKLGIHIPLGRYRPDHPHTRGEIGHLRPYAPKKTGPSPHAWGNW